ncbi:hypothetical protein SAMN05216188_107245 [Lentzea xinjiangensis]|uniref:DUF2087 domain-containing protein n=1 Tax=Lentzea xinjiangensis TaxID=402600 RepID=A0A1H9L425_9PSEU|nr:DUF2087 domain-containing protein [Lentzea xinjiangensis]SER06146.1 hypothetical protein SAMN05216188_107245 [Lentzea xinjiangensis]
MTTAETVVRVLAEPARLRAFAAVVLGAGTPADVAAASGLPLRDAGTALRKLREAGLVEGDPVRPADLKPLAATLTERPPADGLAPFVRAGKLISLPVAHERRRRILEHVASKAFEPRAYYEEKEINERLRAWCDGGEVDHVTIRRYLVDLGLLERGGGLYQAQPLPM